MPKVRSSPPPESASSTLCTRAFVLPGSISSLLSRNSSRMSATPLEPVSSTVQYLLDPSFQSVEARPYYQTVRAECLLVPLGPCPVQNSMYSSLRSSRLNHLPFIKQYGPETLSFQRKGRTSFIMTTMVTWERLSLQARQPTNTREGIYIPRP